jgi:photosystem II stability/assembly factor-like uncharacterized protein
MDAFLLSDSRHGWIALGYPAGGLYATNDEGDHWRRVHSPHPQREEVFNVWFADPNRGFIVIWNDTGPYAYSLARTLDGGKSWRVVRRWLRRP